jgi:uncharacterized protein (TIGR00369 family)
MTPTITPETTQKIRDSFARQTMMTTFGAGILSLRAGEVILSAPLLPGTRQQQGFGHAALTFGLGDSAAGYAALTLTAPEEEVLTTEMKINLIAPAAGDLLIATGRVIKAGRRLIVVTAEVEAEADGKRRLIAILQGSMMPVS